MLTAEREKEMRDHIDNALSEDHACLDVKQARELLIEINRLKSVNQMVSHDLETQIRLISELQIEHYKIQRFLKAEIDRLLMQTAKFKWDENANLRFLLEGARKESDELKVIVNDLGSATQENAFELISLAKIKLGW